MRNYEKHEEESFEEYETRRVAELAAYRHQPGYQAILDVIEAEVLDSTLKENSAASPEALWTQKSVTRALQRVYDRIESATMTQERASRAQEEARIRRLSQVKSFERERQEAIAAIEKARRATGRKAVGMKDG